MEVGASVAVAPAEPAPQPSSPSSDNTVSVRIPQIGEGLQEARLVAVLKQPGDLVKRDEPIYQMETDKAVMDVESPYEGVLTEWLAPVDTVLAIGAEVARMKVAPGVSEVGTSHHAAETIPSNQAVVTPTSSQTAVSAGLLAIPPRTRAYAAEKGVPLEALTPLVSQKGKVLPADIDQLLSGSGTQSPKPAGASPGGTFSEQSMNAKQRLLSSRLMRGNQLVVPGTMTVAMNWEPIEGLRARYKSAGSDFQPSAFTMFAFACVKALAEFPAFRSTLRGDDTIRTYDHVNLGIAVSLPGDELVIAAVDKADTMDWRTFADSMRERIALARNGQDQAHEGVTVSLTNMQHNGIRDAVAVVVPPAVATVFLGESYNGLAQGTSELKIQRCANLGITFDHRLINGVGAADFQNRIKEYVETIGSLITL